MSEQSQTINWIKTSERAPNPTDNPIIIVAGVPNDAIFAANGYRPKFRYCLCAGGKQVEHVWQNDEERSQFASTHWFKSDDIDVVSAADFTGWLDLNSPLIPWVSGADILERLRTKNIAASHKLPLLLPDLLGEISGNDGAALIVVPKENARLVRRDNDDGTTFYESADHGAEIAAFNLPEPVTDFIPWDVDDPWSPKLSDKDGQAAYDIVYFRSDDYTDPEIYNYRGDTLSGGDPGVRDGIEYPYIYASKYWALPPAPEA